MTQTYAKIIGTGSFVPNEPITNDMLVERLARDACWQPRRPLGRACHEGACLGPQAGLLKETSGRGRIEREMHQRVQCRVRR